MQAVIKEEFSYYNSSGPKYEKFSKYLTVKEMVRLHFDPYISTFDLSKQPILVLDKVDKYWPVPSSVVDIKTEVKEEPVEDDAEWERAAEEEILAANEGLFESYSPVAVSPPPSLKRPKRKKTKPKSYKEDWESDKDPDTPDIPDDDEDSMFDEENNFEDDPDFEDDKSDISFSMDMLESDDSNTIYPTQVPWNKPLTMFTFWDHICKLFTLCVNQKTIQ